MNNCYGKTKEELGINITKLLQDKDNISDNDYIGYTRWLKWYNHYSNKIKLKDLKGTDLSYRAFYMFPRYLSIQVYKNEPDGIRKHIKTLYQTHIQIDFEDQDFNFIKTLKNI